MWPIALQVVWLLALLLRAQAQVATDPALGEWSNPIPLPIVPVAAAVRDDGRVRLSSTPPGPVLEVTSAHKCTVLLRPQARSCLMFLLHVSFRSVFGKQSVYMELS